MGRNRDKTNIEVYTDTWRRLKEKMDRPGVTFDDVINDTLDRLESNTETIPEVPEEDTQEDDDREQGYHDPIDEILDTWSPTYYEDRDENKEEVGEAALELLKDRGTATRKKVKSMKGDQLPDADVTENTYWQNYVRIAYKHGRELGYIEFEKNRQPQRYIWVG